MTINYRWCPNLNLKQLSESESDTLKINLVGRGVSAKGYVCVKRVVYLARGCLPGWGVSAWPGGAVVVSVQRGVTV